MNLGTLEVQVNPQPDPAPKKCRMPQVGAGLASEAGDILANVIGLLLGPFNLSYHSMYVYIYIYST